MVLVQQQGFVVATRVLGAAGAMSGPARHMAGPWGSGGVGAWLLAPVKPLNRELVEGVTCMAGQSAQGGMPGTIWAIPS